MSATVKLTLVQRIIAILKLDDKGKVQGFFDGEVKACKIEIKKLQSNQKQQDLADEIELDELERKIEDAIQAIDDAYLNVDVTRIQTNQDKIDFSVRYWERIKSADHRLSSLKEQQEEKLQEVEEFKKDNDEQIAAYNVRIAKLNS